ncbi:hypothetical protein FLX56_22215 [Synechococcus moorigangaii CMS01]|nr:hypothetical protein [Synechococcus moorigangaii CMS01]
MGRLHSLETAYGAFDLADALRIACELNIDITKPEPWLRVYYDTINHWQAGFMGPEWPPAFIHSLAVLIQALVADPENPWQWETLPEGAWDLVEQDQRILQHFAALRQ